MQNWAKSAKLELSHLRYDDHGVPQLLIRKPLSFVAHYAHPRYHLVIWWPTSITSENVIIIRLNYNQGSALWCYSIVGTNIQVKLHELCFFPFLWNNLISRSLIIKKFASKTEFRAIFFLPMYFTICYYNLEKSKDMQSQTKLLSEAFEGIFDTWMSWIDKVWLSR